MTMTCLDLAWLWTDAGSWQPEAGRRISFDEGGIASLDTSAPETICGLAGLPPLVNGHDHGRAFRTVDFGANDGPLETWIPALCLTPQIDPYLAAAAAFGRMARSGIAATVHCHTPQGGDPIAEAGAVARAAQDVGIHVAYVVPIVDKNTMLYGDASPLCGRHRAADLAAIKSLTGEPAPATEQVALVEEIAYQCESSSFHVQFGPAGPQWCSPGALQLVAERSATTGRRVHMHLLETKMQREWADAAYPVGIIAALDAIGLWSPRVAVAHGVWLTAPECRMLAERGVTVVVNTSSNFRLRSGVVPLRRFTDAGLPFAIGLDGMAFDDDDDMLRELRLVHALHAPWGFESEGVSQAEILQAATVTGWEVISGRTHQQLLKPGAAANLLVLDWEELKQCSAPSLADAAGMFWARASTRCVRDLYVDGRRIVAESALTGIDLQAIEAELLAAIRAQSQALNDKRPSILAHQQLLTEYYRSGKTSHDYPEEAVMNNAIAIPKTTAQPVPLRAWHHTSLAVADLDTAICFYRDAFGFEPVFIVRGMEKQIARISGVEGLQCDLAQLRLAEIGQPPTQHVLELIAFRFPTAEQTPIPALMRGHISFHVANLDQALAIAQQHGAVLLGAITEFAEGRSVYCREPAGSLLELEEIWDASILQGGKR